MRTTITMIVLVMLASPLLADDFVPGSENDVTRARGPECATKAHQLGVNFHRMSGVNWMGTCRKVGVEKMTAPPK